MKEVRRKYVLYAMLAVFVLLLGILTIINAVNFTMAAADADAVTARLAENKGRFSDNKAVPETPDVPGQLPEGPVPGGFSAVPFSPEGFGPMGPDSPETGFSLRYFTVRFGKNGEAGLSAYQIAAVSEEEALAWAKALKGEAQKKDVTGWTRGTYRYRCYTKGDAVYVTVIDQGRELTPSYRILVISLIGMGFGLLISFLFLSLISRRLFRPLEEADRRQRRFLEEAEKDLKIPLTVIQADTELIEREHGPSDYTSSIHRQTERMADLTRDLGRLTLFDTSAPAALCDLNAILHQAAEEAREALQKAGIRLSEQYAGGVMFRADPELVKRIADELTENIVKFGQDEALIRTEKKGKRLIVTFSNGCTLPEGSCENVFDRFIRLANAEGKAGAGLGLSFVRDAVLKLGGRAAAEVRDGRFLLKLSL